MNTYITAPTIKVLREQKKLTQAQLADQLSVSHKTISKWETGKGLPDISLLEPLAKALGVSLPELFSAYNQRQPVRQPAPVKALCLSCLREYPAWQRSCHHFLLRGHVAGPGSRTRG